MNPIQKSEESDSRKWYIATAITCLIAPAFVSLIVLTVLDCKKRFEKNDAILFSSIGAFVYALSFAVIFAAVMPSIPGPMPVEMVFVMIVMPAIAALYLFIVYFLHARYARRLARCLSLVKNEHITSLDELGMILGTNTKQTKKYVLRLIKKGFLDGAIINETKRLILFSKSIWTKQKFECENCGAVLIYDYGHLLVCDYCGQALPVKRY